MDLALTLWRKDPIIHLKTGILIAGKNPLEVRMDFKAGDMAVYPAHGVGIVEKIEGCANRGTSTLQVETTVAVTNRGAEAD
jgi:hypothetical protein